MKRSRAAVLLMMSAVPLVLTACGATDAEQVREGLYTSVDACVADTNDRATCSEALAQALAKAAQWLGLERVAIAGRGDLAAKLRQASSSFL